MALADFFTTNRKLLSEMQRSICSWALDNFEPREVSIFRIFYLTNGRRKHFARCERTNDYDADCKCVMRRMILIECRELMTGVF